ncbi:hypothetical protein ACROYT_G007542 [Oculina patagonica]
MGMTKCHAVTSITIGVLQLVLAVGLIIASFIFASYGSMNTSQTPYWGGFPFLITGAFGIAAGITKNQCCMVTFLVLNIIMTITTAAASIVVTVALAFWNGAVNASNCRTVHNTCVCDTGNPYDTETYNISNCDYLDTVTVALLAVLIFCYCCAGLAFAGSILGCAATCCAPPDAPTVIIAQPQMVAPGVMVTHSSMQAGYPPVAAGYPPGAYGQPMFAEQTASTHDKAPLVV